MNATREEIVVCSLEAWDEIWRRNQFLTNELLMLRPDLRVLFVEPAADVLFELSQRRRPVGPRMATLREDGRLRTLRPLKLLPRRMGPFSDRLLFAQVLATARQIGFTRPTLWLNDITYAPLIRRTGWPAVYDVTDDWLLAPAPSQETERLRRLDRIALAEANEVVVCSPALADSRGARREVTLIANGVDFEHFRRPRPRPPDLPPAPAGAYVGTLHESRLDVELLVELARAIPELAVTLIGPDALAAAARLQLAAQPNIHMLGPRPYADVPAYLQHADVVLVPHRVTPFTDSLDPIKAYECLALETPTVATPVAGFRELADRLTVAAPRDFEPAVRAALSGGRGQVAGGPLPSWQERGAEFDAVLRRAAER
jgi:teichuronic acid biosynthesis glycosyltransferase TuaH